MRAHITLQNRLSETARLTPFVERFAAAHGLAADEAARLQVILEELLTNVVKYGYAETAGRGSIAVTLALEDGRLSIEFDDDGIAFDPLTHQPPDLALPAEQRPVGGLGLHILRSLADEAHYRREDGRNHVSLVRRVVR